MTKSPEGHDLTPDQFAELILSKGPFSREELLAKTREQVRDYFIVASSALRRVPGLLDNPKRVADFRWYVENAIWDDPPVAM
jgi:hypothetical protein